MKYALLALLAFLTSCTINLEVVHTEGTATGVGDEAQSASPDITATVPLIE